MTPQVQSNEKPPSKKEKEKKLLEHCILIWPFDKAPAIYQTLVKLKGGEKWLVYIPKEANKENLQWLEAMNTEQAVDVYFGGQLRVGYVKPDSTTEEKNES